MTIVIIMRNNRAIIGKQIDVTPHDIGPKSSRFIPALNWRELEGAAMVVVQAASKLAEIYDCPPELAKRARFPRKWMII